MPRRVDAAILATARRMHRIGLVVGTVGNVSARSGDRLRITPTALEYEAMRRRDLVTVDLVTGAVHGRRAPSRELPLHLAVARARPDVGAIVHTHSAAATAWSFVGEPLAADLEDLAYYGIGAVATAAPAPAGSETLAAEAVRGLGSGKAVLLGAHGVLAVGSAPREALTVAEAVEHQARVALLVRAALSSRGRPAPAPP